MRHSESELFEILRRRSLYWLAQREQSEVELRRKLMSLAQSQSQRVALKRGGRLSPDLDVHIQVEHDDVQLIGLEEELAGCVDRLIDDLKSQGYLSDQRFIESRVRGRQSRFGLQRIQQELAVHGLALEGEELRQLAESELQRAHAVWARKFDGPPRDSSGRASQVRFLMQRGFSSEVIRRVLKGEGATDVD